MLAAAGDCDTNVQKGQDEKGKNAAGEDTDHGSDSKASSGAPRPVSATFTKPTTTTGLMKFNTKFLEIIEELKMRREYEVESEETIKSLVAAQHKLEQNLEEEKTRYNRLLEQQTQQELQMKRLHEEQLRRSEEEKRKLTLSLAAKEKEFKVIKDEIRALHMTRYNHEKKLKEQERTLHLYSTSRDSILSQITQLEQNCSTAFSKVLEITDQMERLDANAKQAVLFNKKLRYINSHQQCLVDETKLSLETASRQLLDTRVALASREEEYSVPAGSCSSEELSRLRSREQELKVQEELVKQLQNQLSQSREEQNSLQHLLQNAHQLIDRHVRASSKAAASEAALKEEVRRLNKIKEDMEVESKDSRETYIHQQKEREKSLQETQKQCTDLSQRLNNLHGDYTALQKSHEAVQTNNQQFVTENQNLSSSLETLKHELTVFKEDRRTKAQLDERVKELQRELEECQKEAVKKSVTDRKLDYDGEHKPDKQEILVHSEGVIEKDQDGSPHAGATKRPCPDSPLSTSEGGPQQEITTTPLSSTTKKPRLDCDTAEISTSAGATPALPLPVDTVLSSSESEVPHTLTVTDSSMTIDKNSSKQDSAQLEEGKSDRELIEDLKESSVSVIFSDDEALSGDEDRVMDTQLSEQINKVQSFLKMDRLRRTKQKK